MSPADVLSETKHGVLRRRLFAEPDRPIADKIVEMKFQRDLLRSRLGPVVLIRRSAWSLRSSARPCATHVNQRRALRMGCRSSVQTTRSNLYR